ncbi:MAG TPA: hypothetical protein VL051_00605 [Burkholderiaceae bacterium]|nr:hypothetical protein [Burkholderiaceae bacterium]
MHIVAIAWIYVVLMMAITERSVVAAIMTFLLYGVLPLTIILYIGGSRGRRRRARAQQEKSQADAAKNSQPTPAPDA